MSKNTRWTDDEQETAERLRAEGMSLNKIAETMNRSYDVVYRRVFFESERPEPWHPLKDNARLLRVLQGESR